MNKRDLEKLISKRENALALIKVWEEELEIKNNNNNDKLKLKEKNISPKILCVTAKINLTVSAK